MVCNPVTGYTDEEMNLNRLYLLGMTSEYRAAIDAVSSSSRCVDMRMIEGTMSHLIWRGKVPPIEITPVKHQFAQERCRCHAQLNKKEMAILVEQIRSIKEQKGNKQNG